MKELVWPIRVYYEDTDAGGVVFYARYLAFMERARTEWLRSLGFANSALAQEAGVVFAVRRVEADYLAPARLDDQLEVTAEVTEVSRASLTFKQEVRRGTQALCRASVKIVCLDSQRFRPTGIPQPLSGRLIDE